MKRRWTALLCAALMLGASVPAAVLPMTVSAEETTTPETTVDMVDSKLTEGDYTYQTYGTYQWIDGEKTLISTDYAVLTWYSGEALDVVVPAEIGGVPVRELSGTFKRTKITSAVLPDTLTSIGGEAFNRTNITEIVIPEGVTLIEGEAFNHCEKLERAVLPSTLEKIDWSAFRGCSSLREINIPESVQDIERYAFAETGIEQLTIPNVKTIGQNAFERCDSLQSVTFGEGVEVIGQYAFTECTNLSALTLSDTVTYINDHAFLNCPLTEVTIPASVGTIELAAFSCAETLTSVTVLNPECVIWDDWNYGDTISNANDENGKRTYTGTIYGYDGSTAQAYCEKHGYHFESLGAAPVLRGDVDDDGTLSVADVVLLQKWILAVPDTALANGEAADVYEDGVVDVFDLAALKRALINVG